MTYPAPFIDTMVGGPCDQARELRAAMARRPSAAMPILADRCRSLVIASGKGGTGKSVLTLNLAILLAQSGQAVGILDMSGSNLGLLCRKAGDWNLDDVAAGMRTLEEVTVTGPENIRIISVPNLAFPVGSVRDAVRMQLERLEQQLDWLLIDSSFDDRKAKRLSACCDGTLIVTTPEPTSVTSCFQLLKGLGRSSSTPLSIMVNQAGSTEQGRQIVDRLRHLAGPWLERDINMAGVVPRAAAVVRSVYRREPWVVSDPLDPSTEALKHLCQRLQRVVPLRSAGSFVEELTKQVW